MLYINGKQMQLRKIRIKIKDGYTTDDFAEYFGVSSKIFLDKLQERLTTDSFGEYDKMLAANERKPKNTSKKQKLESEETAMNEAMEVKEESFEERRIRELENIIAFHNGELASYESQLKENANEKDQIHQQIEAVKERMAEYAQKIREANQKLNELQEQKECNLESFSVIQNGIAESKSELEKAQIELESYQKVVISFGESGIQISKDGIEPSAEEVEEKFLELSDTDPYADYSARNLRKAAEVLCSIDNIELMGLEYEVDYGKFEAVKEIVEGVRAA